MLGVSARFLATLTQPHTVALEAHLYPPGSETGLPVPVVSGSVSADRTASVRRSGSLELPADVSIEGVEDLRTLAFGGYVLLRRGIRYGDGTKELANVGLLRINSVTLNEAEGTAELDLSDRMAQVADERLATPYSTTGRKASDAILELVAGVFPDVLVFDTTDLAAQPVMTDATYRERDVAIADLAAGIGAQAFFDPSGSFCLFPLPTLADEPVWAIQTGSEGVLVNVTESVDRTATANGVAVVGQEDAESPPILGLATDDDPGSPLYWGGPYGRVLLIDESASVTTDVQAAAAADAKLAAQLGLGRQLSFSFVPNPALEPGDVVDVVIEGVTERHVIDALSIPLDPSSQATIASRTLYSGAPALLGLHPLGLSSRARYVGPAAWQELEQATEIIA